MSWEGQLFRPGFPKTETYDNPYNTLPAIPGDYTPFYITITICTIVLAIILLINIYCCCSERYKDYWLDNNTGNRWIFSVWTSSPKNQAPALLTA